VSSAVYLTFLRIDLSTITREDSWGGDVENVNYEAELKTETRNIIQNLCTNRYDNVLVILKKKVNFMSKKTLNTQCEDVKRVGSICLFKRVSLFQKEFIF
jgi:hypothetical protein